MTSESNSKDSGPVFDWLYPDLLHVDVLIDLLQKRCIMKDGLASLSKYELVELYNKYLLPLPQRKYKLNRRGREMHSKQQVSAKNKRLSYVDEDQPVEKKVAMGKLLTSFEMPTAIGDRLKPPPSCVSLDKKTIKLNLSATSSSSSSSSSDAVSTVLQKHKLSMNDNDHQKTPKKIKLPESVTSDSPAQEPAKRENCDASIQEVKNDDKKNGSGELKTKAKFTKISWP